MVTVYRCKDCNCEYANKPLYCSCGNTLFEQISVQNVKSAVSGENRQQSAAQSDKDSLYKNDSRLVKFFKTLDPASAVIFVVCIILSVIILVL